MKSFEFALAVARQFGRDRWVRLCLRLSGRGRTAAVPLAVPDSPGLTAAGTRAALAAEEWETATGCLQPKPAIRTRSGSSSHGASVHSMKKLVFVRTWVSSG